MGTGTVHSYLHPQPQHTRLFSEIIILLHSLAHVHTEVISCMHCVQHTSVCWMGCSSNPVVLAQPFWLSNPVSDGLLPLNLRRTGIILYGDDEDRVISTTVTVIDIRCYCQWYYIVMNTITVSVGGTVAVTVTMTVDCPQPRWRQHDPP